MAQIKIFGHAVFLKKQSQAISDAIHQSVMAALAYPPEKRFHRFMALEDWQFVHPDDRSDQYLIIEISLFEGRTEAAKKHLIQLLFVSLKSIGIAAQDVEITLFETPKSHWGIRGCCGDELALNYRVEV